MLGKEVQPRREVDLAQIMDRHADLAQRIFPARLLRQQLQTLGYLLAHPLAYLLEISSVILLLVGSDRPTTVMSDET